ncbi:MAG: hypothetical protein HYR56_25315 [Acidobacteria bacterium]|nr:hypothetical protein [Acidobacteriota bacterium]MBI3421569.1 hypothetical protein [Acidobacteriota bacterium]
MNCREFNEVLNDLTSDRLSDALARKRALVHAGACEACARRLAAQRALSASLFEFAEVTGKEQPPLRIRQQLRAAVAERRAAPAVAQSSATVLAFKSAAKPNHWRRWALAAAATVLALFTISVLLWRQSQAPAQSVLAGAASPTPQMTPAVPSVSGKSETTATDLQPRTQLAQRHAPKQRRAQRVRAVEAATDEQELASEFVPLTLDTDERALANGTLVRLEVPRARLIAMGLPLRVEADRDTINAEVMMGDNGVAYAIRVVR